MTTATTPLHDERPAALATVAHPDDIEFHAAGTLLLLREAGWAIHYLNVADGDCGSMTMSREETSRIRAREARTAAGILGAEFHESLATDLLIFYEERLLRRVAAVVRRARPRIVLTHSPEDSMEDHWLDASQGMDSYLDAGDEMSRRVGRMSGRFEHAEGWRRHLHLGFSASEQDPLADALRGRCHAVQPLSP
jgi:LmbE family N-acetylglucosaminyl deacetylase